MYKNVPHPCTSLCHIRTGSSLPQQELPNGNGEEIQPGTLMSYHILDLTVLSQQNLVSYQICPFKNW